MLNATQLYLLDSFIGDEGNYFETIRDDQSIDLATKVLYLQRAITQDCQTFLRSLDKLYRPELVGKDQAAHLELIRSFKAINDMYFNNTVKFGESGLASARERYFKGLGSIDNADFIESTQSRVNARIQELSGNNTKEIQAQIVSREAAEENITPQQGWRFELDLPLSQRPPQQEGSVGHLVTHLRNSTFNPADEGAIFRLITELHISRAELLALNAPLLAELLRAPDNVVRLLNIAHIPLASLLTLDAPLCAELMSNLDSVARLVNEVHIPPADLLTLDAPLRAELMNNSHMIAKLVNEVPMPLAQLLTLDAPLRTELLRNVYEVTQLVHEIRIPLAEFLTFDTALRTELLSKTGFCGAMLDVHLPPAERLTLTTPLRIELVRNARNVAQLVDAAHIPLTQLLAFDAPLRAELLANSSTVKLITEKGIPYERLIELPVPVLHNVLINSESEESQSILNSLRSKRPSHGTP